MSAAQARQAEEPLDIPAMIESALAQTRVVEVTFPRRAPAEREAKAENRDA
jgi:hypothetical protein